VRDFTTPLSPIYRPSRQKINSEILELKDTIDQMDLTDVYRIFHVTTTQYTFFSASHGAFNIDILGHKAASANMRKQKEPPAFYLTKMQ
jgi:exonuclease III